VVELFEQPKKLELSKEEIEKIGKEKPKLLEPNPVPLRNILPSEDIEKLKADAEKRDTLIAEGRGHLIPPSDS